MSPLIKKLTNQNEISEIAEFVLTHARNLYVPTQRHLIEKFIEEHMKYGTLIVVRAKDGIVAVCRWNWFNPQTIKVLDLIIRPDHRNREVMKSVLVQGLMANPWAKYMSFHRKKHNRDITCLISKFIGRKYNGRRT